MAQVLQFRRRLNPEVKWQRWVTPTTKQSPGCMVVNPDVIREVVAKRIVRMARASEPDPHRLRDAASSGLRSPRAA